MPVDTKTVREMAKLARLSIAEDRLDAAAADMTAILDFMGAIAEWEGTSASQSVETRRRIDEPQLPEGQTLIDAASQAEAGEVIVPPIKGAS